MHHPGGTCLHQASLAYGGGGVQSDANETIYLFCKCFNNKGVTVYITGAIIAGTTQQQGLAPKKAQVNSAPDTVKKGVDFANRTLNTFTHKRIQYKSNSQSYRIHIYIYIYNIYFQYLYI
jgi:hypothetical protein